MTSQDGIICTETMMREYELDILLSTPWPQAIEMMRRLEGDIMILGVAGKMGVSLALTALRAIEAAGVAKKVLGVARFSNSRARDVLEEAGIATIPCDLLNRDAVSKLPAVRNIVFMAGRKFGTQDNEDQTWAMNVIVPGNVAEHFANSRIVAFSSGCVYPFVHPESGGCTESYPTDPLGEYAQSCVGRERIFQFYSDRQETRMGLVRLNYAIDLRYGVLHDIAQNILQGQPVDVRTGYFNCIWQADANNLALLILEHCRSPASIWNVTGPETISVRSVTAQLATGMGRELILAGEEASTALLSNSANTLQQLGQPTVSLDQMIDWTAHWLLSGGRSLNQPTHFEVRDGKF